MKFALLFTVTAALSAPLAAKPVDWTRTVAATPAGFMIGNPKAPVKLVEYGSYTCPHCRVFQQEAMSALRAKYIASGRISFEFRSFVRNGPDYAASLLAACEGVPKIVANTDLLFASQPEWIKPFAEIDEATAKSVAAVPKDRQLAALAKAGKLDTFMAAHGLPAAKAGRCLADKVAADRLTATLKAAVETDKVDGTPGFLINGVRQVTDGLGGERGVTTWADLEPRLVKALGGASSGAAKALR